MNSIILSASSYADDIDRVIIIVALLGGFWLILAEFVLFYLIFKFRAKNDGSKSQYIQGESHEEAKWIHWPHYVVIVCDIVIIGFAAQAWYHVKQELPRADDTVKIVGQQWAWTFVHSGPDGVLGNDDDITLVDELHVRVNRLYHYKLESVDVLHDFSVPVFRLKQDAIPGRTITGWFEPTRVGQFDIQCAEMCGIGHGLMPAVIYVHSDEDYDAWMNRQLDAQVRPKDESRGLAKLNGQLNR